MRRYFPNSQMVAFCLSLAAVLAVHSGEGASAVEPAGGPVAPMAGTSAVLEPPAVLPEAERLPLSKEKLPPGEVSEEWVHASQTSAVIYWQTENRAGSYVEYGSTDQYGQKTPSMADSWVVGRPYYTQWHRITALEPQTQYHYRTVSVGTDGKEVRGPDKTFKTIKHADAINLPGDLKGPPYVLDKAGATYVLTADMAAPRGAIVVAADDVTLDMDGHTVTYNTEAVTWANNKSLPRIDAVTGVYGVRMSRSAGKPVKLLNGTIRQGAGQSSGSAGALGCNPLYAVGPPIGTEIAGIEFIWSGGDVSGLFIHWGGAHVHHCIMEDRGSGITNRHQAVGTVDGNGTNEFDHNLVRATRQRGLDNGVKVFHNEVYTNSYATNSFAISPRPGKLVEVAHNKVFGCGQHPVAFAMMGVFEKGSRLHHNHAEVMGTRKGREYGWTGCACFRTTWGADNLDVGYNKFIGYSRTRERGGIGSTGQTRILWVGLPNRKPEGRRKEPITNARGVFHDNVMIARGLDDTAKACGIGVVCMNQSPNLMFINNTVISTWGNVLLSDPYGSSGGHPKFVGNTFKREGKASVYHTIWQERPGPPATATFLGNKFEGGAAIDSIRPGRGTNLIFQNVLDITVKDSSGSAVDGATVTITDKAGKKVFEAVTAESRTTAAVVTDGPDLVVKAGMDTGDKTFVKEVTLAAGMVKAIVTGCKQMNTDKEILTPHTITVTKGGKSATKTVTVDKDQAIEVKL